MSLSKTKIDRAGNALAKNEYRSIDECIELEDVFDIYRMQHLEPLSATTTEIQNWLSTLGINYYIAQRLKRKPQIIRKLKRLNVRLSQLQDIGGARIVVQSNSDVDKMLGFLTTEITKRGDIKITRTTDYRDLGRDDSGYRALHIMLNKCGMSIELQIRSRIQHYWAENIERTSIIYGHHLKEGEGDPTVIRYFKYLSSAYALIEKDWGLTTDSKIELENLRDASEKIIRSGNNGKVLDSFVNEGIVKTLQEIERNMGKGLNNWIFIFDWNTGSFIDWLVVSRDPNQAIMAYVEKEKLYPAESGFEVVLVGSTDVATIRQTHSHYFGINGYDTALESLEKRLIGFYGAKDLDVGARSILNSMVLKKYWGTKTVSEDTLRNHYCKKVLTFSASLDTLIEKGFVIKTSGLSLNSNKKNEIENSL